MCFWDSREESFPVNTYKKWWPYGFIESKRPGIVSREMNLSQDVQRVVSFCSSTVLGCMLVPEKRKKKKKGKSEDFLISSQTKPVSPSVTTREEKPLPTTNFYLWPHANKVEEVIVRLHLRGCRLTNRSVELGGVWIGSSSTLTQQNLNP